MQVIWKRPDGHHHSTPDDYKVVSIGKKFNLWLHKSEHNWYPFRVSGGWQDEDSTQKLNSLVNLLEADDEVFVNYIVRDFHNSITETIEIYLEELNTWLTELFNNPKGDTWETEIIQFSIKEIEVKVENNTAAIISAGATKATQ